jgi:hypothetical protein
VNPCIEDASVLGYDSLSLSERVLMFGWFILTLSSRVNSLLG